MKVDVIVAGGGAVLAAMHATSIIPIVFTLANDPVGAGLVASLSRPGGNVTGLSLQGPEIASKRLGLMREALPDLRRLAVIANPASPRRPADCRGSDGGARRGPRACRIGNWRAEEFAPAIEMLKGHSDALYACADALVGANSARINALALAVGLPTMLYAREYLEGGGFMFYGPNVPACFALRRFCRQDFRGTRPGDIPVEQPSRLELVVNLKAANKLGLMVPATLLARADEVIE